MYSNQDRFGWITFLLGFVLAASVSSAQFVTDSDLPVDPAVRYGEMSNGMAFAIFPNKEPRERVSLRLFVRAGSLQEKDHQRGLAHYLEHMAFNGTENFAAGEMVEFFQRMGMGFGSHTNAYTSFDQTVYMLDLPRFADEFVQPSMTLLRDFAGGMLFEEAEIERERGVILAEKQQRDSPQFRMFVKEFEFLMAGTLAAERMVIGTDEAIRGVGREDFVEYFNAYYRPERMAVIAVGDFEPDAVELAIREAFEGFAKPLAPVEAPDLGVLPDLSGARGFYAEPEAPFSRVTVTLRRPFVPQPDSLAKRVADMHLGFAYRLINRRFERRGQEADAPFLSASAGNTSYFRFAEVDNFTAIFQPDGWEASLAELEQMLRQVLEYGFTETEWAEVKANALNALEEGAQRRGTRSSRALATSLISAFENGTAFVDPVDYWNTFRPVIEATTVEDLHRAFVDTWQDAVPALFLSGKWDWAPEVALQQLDRVWTNSREVAVAPPIERERGEFAYRSGGKKGEIVARQHIEDLDIHQWTLSNNVRVNLKRTDFRDNEISISVGVGGGYLSLDPEQAELATLATYTFLEGGLEAHSAEELRALFAGKNVSASFSVGSHRFNVSGSTTPRDLEDWLTLLAAYVRHPGFRSDGLAESRRYFDAVAEYVRHNAEGVMMREVPHFLSGGDPRTGWPMDHGALMSAGMDALRGWLQAPLLSEPMELSIVGQFDLEVVESLLLSTIGTLPERKAVAPRRWQDAIRLPEPLQNPIFTFESAQNKAHLGVIWPTVAMEDIQLVRRLSILSSVLRDRLRIAIREEMGESYSPSASHVTSDVFRDYGYLQAMTFGDVGSVARIRSAILETAEKLAAEGTNADELDRVLKPRLTAIEEQLRSNAYWLGNVLSGSASVPEQIDWARTILTDNDEVTVEEISSLARRFLRTEALNVIKVLPRASGATRPLGDE